MSRPRLFAYSLPLLAMAVALLGSVGCSALLGDFTVGDAPADASIVDGAIADGTFGHDGSGDSGPITNDAGADVAQTDGGGDGSSCAKTQCGVDCVDTSNDVKNCGRCGNDCTALQHVASTTGVTCNAGVCTIPPSACATSFAHCSTNPQDGCETDLTSVAHCRDCAKACAAGEVCTAAGCAANCPVGTTLCGTTCSDTTKDPNHCGLCSTSCPQPPAGGNATCTNKLCGVQCVSGWHQCNSDPVCASDTDATRCGSSCRQCAAPQNAQATCSANGCDFVCNQGLTNCGGACVTCPTGGTCSGQTCGCANGKSNCNGTCVACPAGGVCSGATCGCGNGTINCNGTCAPCPAGGVCSGTTCTCPQGTTLCSGTCVTLSKDPANCGACGSLCPAGADCFNSVCTTCKTGETTCMPCPGNSADDCIMTCNAARTGWTMTTDCGYAQPNDRCTVDSSGAHCI